LSTNHLPDVRGTDYGTWRRLKVLPFQATFDQDTADKSLAEKLRAEMPGILNWVVAGTRDWLARGGLDEPPEVKAAVEEFREGLDLVGLWLDECCEVGPDLWATSKALHGSYTAWADGYGADALSDKQLGARLAEKGFQGERRRIDGRQARIRVGLQPKALPARAARTPPNQEPETSETTETRDSGSSPMGGRIDGFQESPSRVVSLVTPRLRRLGWRRRGGR
jgi:putative DNA primase/helicase